MSEQISNELGPLPRGVIRPTEEAAIRAQERRYVYEYLKAQAEDVHTRSVLREWSRTQVGNNLVRLAGEILRGLHVDPVKINNPELWK
jgi:hypothetical protein